METPQTLTPAQALAAIVSSQPTWKFDATNTNNSGYIASGTAPRNLLFYTEGRIDGKHLTTYMLENDKKLKPYYENVVDALANSFTPLMVIESPSASVSVPAGLFHKSLQRPQDPQALLFESANGALLQLTTTDFDGTRAEYLKGLPKQDAETVDYQQEDDWAFLIQRHGGSTTVKKLAFKANSVAICTLVYATGENNKLALTIDMLGSTLRHK